MTSNTTVVSGVLLKQLTFGKRRQCVRNPYALRAFYFLSGVGLGGVASAFFA